ncbi:hypothetical protein NKR19_g8011 [Coniochaeta hoffmannii]|uniref:Uncharacterized protein n=1 Tax=Coniochaeta hoffmannii TaxID=91930 RepID=A0AA38R766_9PEZI|nr:hypothetical protein NKR19_g8011 [Coniochaeta hoffmannii]
MLHDQLKHFIMGDLLALDVYRWTWSARPASSSSRGLPKGWTNCATACAPPGFAHREEEQHVLLIKAWPRKRSIDIEKWAGGPLCGTRGDQSVSIASTADPRRFTVSGGPLRLSFRTLFGRDKRFAERDIVLDERMLKNTRIREE